MIEIRFIAKFIHQAAMTEISDKMLVKGNIKDIGNHAQTMRAAIFNRVHILFNGGVTCAIGKKTAHQGKASPAQIYLKGRLFFNILEWILIGIVRSKQV